MVHPLRNTVVVILMFLVHFSCTRERFTTSRDAILTTSADTLHFDTVFTSAGSVSQLFKIFNNNRQGIHINSVRLAGGNTSPFRINVDGQPGPQAGTVDVAPQDSAYVFVTVKIDPTAANLPFIVRDSIEIDYNGNKKWVQLDAYGRNAHFLHNRLIRSDETWTNDLPYVITGGLVVDTNATLSIEPGCRIYVHADAPFIINGSLQVNGGKEDSLRVVFTGDRLDDPYRNFPASYPGLIFTPSSHANILRYTTIKNAYQGIALSGQPASSMLTLEQTIVDNAYDAGIIAINSNIQATNVLVSNCGSNLVLAGGNYTFVHSTLVAYPNIYMPHKNPVLFLSNVTGTSMTTDLNARFTNCIIWGDSGNLLPDEAVVTKKGTTAFQVSFDHVLMKNQNPPPDSQTASMIYNLDPLFDSVNTSQPFYDFQLKAGSPAIDKGTSTAVTIDLLGNTRPVGLPDLGAYEKQ